MVPPYSGALIISPVVGSSTISFSIAGGRRLLAGRARPQAGRGQDQPEQRRNRQSAVSYHSFSSETLFRLRVLIQYRPAFTLTVRRQSQVTRNQDAAPSV